MPATMIPTQLDRLRALRAAVTEGNMRAITPDCGRAMADTWMEIDQECGDAFGFRCEVCDRERVVELPVRLAHAGMVLRGGA